jgi:uncharacterized protein YndB with AHSA1/START domain
MAVLNVLVDRAPGQVWDVLSDGQSYARWVVGTKRIRDVDPRWPEQGSRIRFSVGMGPWTVEDVTTVRLVDRGRRLELEANAGWLGSARISINLLPWGDDHTLVILDEHPLTGPGRRWHTAVADTLLRVRNQRMVRSLARLVHARHAQQGSPAEY